MVVADGQNQGDQAAQHQSPHLHFAESLPAVPSGGGMAVAEAPHLRQDVDRGHVEEGSSGEKHGDAGGVDVGQSLFAALK